MIGVIVITHGRMGEELMKCAESIVGKAPAAKVLGLEHNEGPAVLERRLGAAVDELASEAGVLILTDMLGGTPCNVGLKSFRTPKTPHDMVTGLNLPMLISALTNRHYMPLDQLAQKLVDDADRNICRPLKKLKGP